MNNTPRLLYDWLSSYVHVSKEYLEKFLTSHPYYPSLHSVTSTIEHLGLKSIALVVDKNDFTNLPTPFLIHLEKGRGEFMLVTNSVEFQKENPAYIDQWDGIVVIIERGAEAVSKENSRLFSVEKKAANNIYWWLAGLIAICSPVLILSFSVVTFGFWLTSIAGVFISLQIVQHELGVGNTFVEKLCGFKNKIDCDSVLKSDAAQLYKDIKLGDVGIAYFMTNAVALSFSIFTNNTSLLLPYFSILSVLALPFTMYSVYYQWRVVKKWCSLCLMILLLLWGQAMLLAKTLCMIPNTMAEMNIEQIGYYSFSMLLVSGCWFLVIKPMMKQRTSDKVALSRLRSFQRNPSIFFDSLKQQRRIDTKPFVYEIELGNPAATFQVIVASNLACKPCSELHNKMHDLLAIYGERMSLIIRFTFQDKSRNQEKDKAAEHILSYLLANETGDVKEKTMLRREVLSNWFTWLNEVKFYQTYPCLKNMEVENLVQQHLAWTRESDIQFTPSLFINGFELPSHYRFDEFTDILPDLITYNEEFAEDIKFATT